MTDDLVYMAVTLGATLVYLGVIIFHHFHLINEAKIYFAIVVQFWYILALLCMGGNFSQSIVAVTTTAIIFLMFKKQNKLRNKLVAFNIILFILPNLYLAFYPPIFGLRDYPFDEIAVFILCACWISIVFSIYDTNTKLYVNSLKENNKLLQQKTLELERFTYIASHDLRAPVRNISSFLGLIRRKLKQGQIEKIEDYLDFAEQGTKQLNELMQGVLEISMINDNSVSLPSYIDLNSVIEKSVDNLQKDLNDKNAVVNTGNLPNIYANETELVILFQNLIQNGIKYNRSAAPRVNVYSIDKPGKVHVVVKDNGIGIHPDHTDQIFQYFKRLHTHTEFNGTGIGLGLCKKIVEKYNGKIQVESELNKFTEFHIVIPVQEHYH